MSVYTELRDAYITIPAHLGTFNWVGEDYRAKWGWQVLADSQGAGIMCGQAKNGTPYDKLMCNVPVDPKHVITGMLAKEDSTPPIHVFEPVAKWIKATEPDRICVLLLQIAAQDDLLLEVLAMDNVPDSFKARIGTQRRVLHG